MIGPYHTDRVTRLVKAFKANRTSNLVRLVCRPHILRSIDELEIFWTRLDHPDRKVDLLKRIPTHVVVVRQFEVFGSTQMRNADGPKLQTNGAFSQSGQIGHASSEALLQVKFGVVVDFALETASRLLWQIIVAIGERSIE